MLNINYHLEKLYGLYEKSYKIHVGKFSNNSFSLVMVSSPQVKTTSTVSDSLYTMAVWWISGLVDPPLCCLIFLFV